MNSLLYAIIVGIVVFFIGNLFLAAKRAAIIGFVVGLLVYSGYVNRA